MRKKILLTIIRIFSVVLAVVLLLVLCLNISTLWAVGRIKQGRHVTSGYFCAIISSGSMEPTVSVNDLLLVRGEESYQPGDVITYISPRGNMVTHRVFELTEDGYITQGDANNVPDGTISKQRVLGRVVYIAPGVGAITEGLSTPMGIAFIVCICLLIWLINRVRRRLYEDET